jgi:hypothetical protein
MKKSKFLLLSLILIFFLGFTLVFVPVGVKAASDGELDIDIEEFWVGISLPLSAMNYYEEDGKGIRFYVEQVAEIELEGTTYRVAGVSSVEDYFFNDGYIYSHFRYPILYQFCSDALISVFNYYFDIYEFPSEIPKFDRLLVIWDVDQQMFVGPDYLFYCIDESYDEGYDAGYDDARPELDILLITLIMYILSIIIYFKFNLKWVLIATTLLWFVPIFLVENLFVKIFCVIMIMATITITFFSDREEEF